MNILDQIIENKLLELEQKKKENPLSISLNLSKEKPIDFLTHLAKDRLFLISEIKKASPSKGIIRKDFDPVEIAKIYSQNGASAISVLTDEKFFMGSLSYLAKVKESVALPLLRKDFIIDPYQIVEAYNFGASAVLLIVAILESEKLKEYINIASAYGLRALVEVHDEKELNIALGVGAEIIGINNRNLKTFHTDLKQTEKLLAYIPKGKVVISESGINSTKDIRYLKSLGVNGVLIGEALMKETDIGKKLKAFLAV